jgi:hypothetical protein
MEQMSSGAARIYSGVPCAIETLVPSIRLLLASEKEPALVKRASTTGFPVLSMKFHIPLYRLLGK